MIKRLFLTATVLAALAATAVGPASAGSIVVGQPAPEFELQVAPGCVPDGETPHYEPFTYGGYFRMRINKNYHHQKDAAQ